MLFRPFVSRRTIRHRAPPARPDPPINMWSQKFFLLLKKGTTTIPSSKGEKLALKEAGCGEKVVTLPFRSSALKLHSQIIVVFPQLNSIGGYELLRGNQGTKNLTLLEVPSTGHNPMSLPLVIGQSRIYIRPLQRDIEIQCSVENMVSFCHSMCMISCACLATCCQWWV